ncbi:MAG: Mpo1-like protein [Mongoliitalea sp.]
MATERIKSLKEFYPYYLSEHQNPTCRRLHFVGTALVFFVLFLAIYMANAWILLLIPVIGYGFAWVGHFFYEKNKPATFQYPFYSLASDFILFYHLLIGKQKFNPDN